MKNLRSLWCLRLILGAALVVMPARMAWAADFHVSPVRLDLNERTRTALLTIENPGPEPLRLQVSLFTWTQDAQGKAVLTPTQDLTWFPSLLTVEPGQSRHIRIGGRLQAANTEKTYRVIVEQLPPALSPQEGSVRIRVLTRMSIPVFVAPPSRSIRGNIEGLALKAGTISFSLRNVGNTHVFAKKARVQGRDAQGKSVLDKEQTGWYVLAGDERQFSLSVPGELCRRLHTLSVEVTTDSGTFPATATLSGDRCDS